MNLRHVLYAAFILCFLVAHSIAFLKINALASSREPASLVAPQSGD